MSLEDYYLECVEVWQSQSHTYKVTSFNMDDRREAVPIANYLRRKGWKVEISKPKSEFDKRVQIIVHRK